VPDFVLGSMEYWGDEWEEKERAMFERTKKLLRNPKANQVP
jgi:hypothetical protein